MFSNLSAGEFRLIILRLCQLYVSKQLCSFICSFDEPIVYDGNADIVNSFLNSSIHVSVFDTYFSSYHPKRSAFQYSVTW